MDAGFNQECLNATNGYRAHHQAQPLKLNGELCRFAQQLAERLAQRGNLDHSKATYGGVSLGENLQMSWNSSPGASEVVKGWYDEIRMYNFQSGSYSMATGHFTQLVWRGSKELGVGKAVCGNVRCVVNEYYPAGNYANRFQQNVLPAGGASYAGGYDVGGCDSDESDEGSYTEDSPSSFFNAFFSDPFQIAFASTSNQSRAHFGSFRWEFHQF